MDDSKLTELRTVVGQHEKLVYEAIKAGKVAELPHESQLIAQAIKEHMHLKHVHNALEFADLREGTPYEVKGPEGTIVSPMAHVSVHSAVKGQIEQDPLVRAAFEKMVATGTSGHHAEHVLSALLCELMWGTEHTTAEKAKATYNRKVKKLNWDSAFRKKLTQRFGADHLAF